MKMMRNGSLGLATQPVFSLLKVMEAEQTKTRSELVHKETAAKYNAAMGRMKQLEKKLKRAINKSKYVLCLEMRGVVRWEVLLLGVPDLCYSLYLWAPACL